MGKYQNTVIPLVVPAGATSNKVTIQTDPGFILRAVICHEEPNNLGMVRALTKGSSGDKISELQPLEIYRSRDVEYSKDGVPMNIPGGGLITYEVIATKPFDSEFQSDLILIYEEKQDC